jgi:pimeloyl-ACP methyl ester carboxylesterase
MVAARYASLHPSRVSALVLEDPPWQTMGSRIAETPLLSFFQGLHAIRRQTSDLQQCCQLLAKLEIRDPSSGSVTRLGDVRDQASLRFTAACLQHMDPAVFEPIVQGSWLDGYPLTETIQGIQCPTLLLQADSCAGGMLTDDDARLFQELSADCTLVRIPGCGHLMHWLRPTELLSHLHAFLASLH